MNPTLWQPSIERRVTANISRFMALVTSKFGVNVSDYTALYQWSVENPAAFWDLMWGFSNIKAARKGEVVLLHEDLMPGAVWFPDARLNYAENLLRHCDKRHFAISFYNENGEARHVTYQELYSQVSQLAQALRNDGIVAGDRVVGVLPNLPETIIAMLAAISLGANLEQLLPRFRRSGYRRPIQANSAQGVVCMRWLYFQRQGF